MAGLSDQDCDSALEFLLDSCEAIAGLKAELERSDILRKRIRRKWFLTFDGSNDVRNAHTEMQTEVHEADERYIAAIGAYEGLKAKRELRVIQTEVYRTQEASRRQVRP